MSCTNDPNNQCGCNNAGPGHECCESITELEQLVNDAVADKETELSGYVDEAKQSAEEAAQSATAAAGSASEAKGYRDQAETAASSATGSLKVITDTALILEESGKMVQDAADEVLTAIAGIAVRNWFPKTTVANQTTFIVPNDMNALAVQNIYLEGSRQDLNRGFTFNKSTMTITLAEPIEEVGTEVTVVLGVYNTDPADSFPVTLASNNGASLVGTSSGHTVQEELDANTKSFQTGAKLFDKDDRILDRSTTPAQLYYWDGTFPKVVVAGSTPASTGGVGLGKWLGIGDSILKEELNSTAGASMIKTTEGDTVQQHFGKIAAVFMMPGQTLMDAESKLPAHGGSIFIPEGTYYAGDYGTVFMQKPNVTLIGAKMASYNASASKMVGGSIIEGKFSVFADNFSMSNVSFDLGLDVCNARFPGADTTADYPHGGTWDAFSFGQVSQVTPLPARMNFSAQNVNGLLKDSATVGHGMLFEGINGGYIDNATGVYGVHGLVIKSENMRIGSINGYMASVDNVIFKSDVYALGGNITCASVMAGRYLPNCTPHSAPAISSYGVYFNPATADFSGPIQIANMQSRDAQYPVMFSNDNAGKTGPDIQFGLVDIDCLNAPNNEYAMFCANFGTYPRMHIASLNIKNCKNGGFFRFSDSGSSGLPQLTIGAFKASVLSGDGITLADFARVHIDSVEMLGAENAYAFADATSLLTVGKERLSVTNKFKGYTPTLAAGWTNFDISNSIFDIALNANKVCLRGLLSVSTGATALITTLPAPLRPAKSIRLPGYKNVGGVPQSCMIGIATSGLVTIDEGAVPANGSFVSLDGVEWELLR